MESARVLHRSSMKSARNRLPPDLRRREIRRHQHRRLLPQGLRGFVDLLRQSTRARLVWRNSTPISVKDAPATPRPGIAAWPPGASPRRRRWPSEAIPSTTSSRLPTRASPCSSSAATSRSSTSLAPATILTASSIHSPSSISSSATVEAFDRRGLRKNGGKARSRRFPFWGGGCRMGT